MVTICLLSTPALKTPSLALLTDLPLTEFPFDEPLCFDGPDKEWKDFPGSANGDGELTGGSKLVTSSGP